MGIMRKSVKRLFVKYIFDLFFNIAQAIWPVFDIFFIEVSKLLYNKKRRLKYNW